MRFGWLAKGSHAYEGLDPQEVADTLRGGGGQDSLFGELGADALNGNGASDKGSTGEGEDPTPINVELVDETFVIAQSLIDDLNGI